MDLAKQTPLAKIKATFEEFFSLPDDDKLAIDFVVALIVANMRPDLTEAVWGYFIGPPSCGKSEILRTFTSLPCTHYVDSLTANALASGYSGDDDDDDPSLLRLLDGKVLVVEDFSPITGIPEAEVAKIMGDFRQAYDGTFRKHSGKVGARNYKAHFGCLIASTPAIDIFAARHQQLGERFLSLRVARTAAIEPREDRVQGIIDTIGSMDGKAIWRLALRKAVTEHISTILSTEYKPVEIDDERIRQIASISDLVARFRTSPIEGHPTEPESGRRIAQQIISMGVGRATADFRSKWNDSDTDLIIRVARDTLPRPAHRVLQVLWNGGQIIPHQGNDISFRAAVHGKELAPLMLQYRYLRIIGHPHGDRKLVQLTDQAVELIKESRIFEPPSTVSTAGSLPVEKK